MRIGIIGAGGMGGTLARNLAKLGHHVSIREHINIFIGDQNIQFTGGLTSSVSAGSEISIVPSISGG